MKPVLITPGEPAGIGPELAVRIAVDRPGLVLVADAGLISQTADRLGLDLKLTPWHPDRSCPDQPGHAGIVTVDLPGPAEPGRLNPDHAPYVLETLRSAADLCLKGQAAALVTGPVHKGIINDAGLAFTGHTGFLAEQAGIERVVMMLLAGDLRVALATTHLPLSQVAAAINRDGLSADLRIVHAALRDRFGIARPRIAVLGLNPHAGEGGHLGREEIEVIEPVIARLRAEGLELEGPLPADTAFVPERLERFDAVFAMYHDQGLPVLKYAGFGRAVNVTLGLPFVRTSVDHGTALELAGIGRADPGSLFAAVALARELATAEEQRGAGGK